MTERSKGELIAELVREFRTSGNQEDAFDGLAARLLGVSETELRCLNIIENGGGLTAGMLAAQAGLTAGAITGVIDRLERRGYVRRVADPADRRRVRIEVTGSFYRSAEQIWGPMAGDWQAQLADGYTLDELETIVSFLRTTNELGRRHMERLRGSFPAGSGAREAAAGDR
jgi:DNA-binding MarR family transcriptional regulator